MLNLNKRQTLTALFFLWFTTLILFPHDSNNMIQIMLFSCSSVALVCMSGAFLARVFLGKSIKQIMSSAKNHDRELSVSIIYN